MEGNFDLQRFIKDASENIRRLDVPEIPTYFDDLEARIGNVVEVLKEESTPDFNHEFLATGLNSLLATVRCLRLKHSMEGEDRVDFPPTIQPYNSGFPNVREFHLIEADKQKSKEVLASLPKQKSLLETIRWKILANEPIEHEQLLLKRSLYFTKVSETDLFPAIKMTSPQPQFVKEENGKRFYTLDWHGIQASPTVPALYRMWFTQDARYAQLHNDSERSGKQIPDLESFVQESRLGVLDLKTFVWRLDQAVDELHPKEIRKYTIGPFFNSLTDNHSEMQEAFDSFEDPSALKYQVEMVISVDIHRKIFRNSWELAKAFVKGKPAEKEIYSDIKLMGRGMIVPLRVKQNLKGDFDEFGNKCKIYGVTSKGEIV